MVLSKLELTKLKVRDTSCPKGKKVELEKNSKNLNLIWSNKFMIRPLVEKDYDTVIDIVNTNWKKTYSDYVSPLLLDEDGCKERAEELRHDFQSKRLSEYVWEEQGQVLALLSIGNTSDIDKKRAFEIWRVYVKPEAQGHNIGSQFLSFSEREVQKRGYEEIIIWAFQRNTNAISFYQKNGYVIDKNEYLGKPYLAFGTRLIKKLINE